MQPQSYDQQVAAAIEEATTKALHYAGQPHNTRAALEHLAQRVATATRLQTLAGLRSAEELAQQFGISRRAMTALARRRHESLGIGRKVGNTWLFSEEEIAHLQPDPRRRPPRRQGEEGQQ